MTQARRSHEAVQLNTGSVLLAGSDQLNVPGAELYNPATNTTAATGNMVTARCYGCAYAKIAEWQGAGHLPSPRVNSKAILLSDGRIMITGGTSTAGTLVNLVDYYVP